MNESPVCYVNLEKKVNRDKEKIFCHQSNGSLVVQFEEMTSLNRENVQHIFQYLKEHLATGKKIILNLQGINSIDAHGLALLIHLNKILQRSSVELVLINLVPAIRKILWITEIDRLIKIQNQTDNIKAKNYDDYSWFELSQPKNSFEN